MKESAETRNLLLKYEQIIEENYKNIQTFLMSINELNSLFQAHLTVVNDLTGKASLAINAKLLCLDEEVSRLSLILKKEKLISNEMFGKNRRRIEACLKSIDEISLQTKRHFTHCEHNALLESSFIVNAKELPSLASVLRDCLSYTDFILPNQSVAAALNGNPDSLYLIKESDIYSLKRCVDLATSRLDEIHKKISDDITGLVSLKGHAHNEEVIDWIDDGPFAIQNVSRELKLTLSDFHEDATNNFEAIDILRASILDAFTDTQFQDVSRQQIEVVAKGLSLCGHYSVELSQALQVDKLNNLSTPNLKDEVIQVMQSSYTMESQRVTHANITGDGIPLEKSNHIVFEIF